jgi:hypothetical protein
MYLPNIVLLSFNDLATGTSSVRLIKQGTALDLGKLVDAYSLYWAVIYDKISVSDASNDLDQLILRNTTYNRWITVAIGGFCSLFICPIAFSGSFLDAVMAFPLGALLVFVQTLAARNELYNNVFEYANHFLPCLIVTHHLLQDCGCNIHFLCRRRFGFDWILLLFRRGISINSTHPPWIHYPVRCPRGSEQEHHMWCSQDVLCYHIQFVPRESQLSDTRFLFEFKDNDTIQQGFGLSMGSEVYHTVFGGPVIGSDDYHCTSSHSVDGKWWQRTASPYWGTSLNCSSMTPGLTFIAAFLCVPMYSLFLTLRNQSPLWRKELVSYFC